MITSTGITVADIETECKQLRADKAELLAGLVESDQAALNRVCAQLLADKAELRSIIDDATALNAKLQTDKAALLAALTGLVEAIDVPDIHGAIDHEWHEAFERACSLIAKHGDNP